MDDCRGPRRGSCGLGTCLQRALAAWELRNPGDRPAWRPACGVPLTQPRVCESSRGRGRKLAGAQRVGSEAFRARGKDGHVSKEPGNAKCN